MHRHTQAGRDSEIVRKNVGKTSRCISYINLDFNKLLQNYSHHNIFVYRAMSLVVSVTFILKTKGKLHRVMYIHVHFQTFPYVHTFRQSLLQSSTDLSYT